MSLLLGMALDLPDIILPWSFLLAPEEIAIPVLGLCWGSLYSFWMNSSMFWESAFCMGLWNLAYWPLTVMSSARLSPSWEDLNSLIEEERPCPPSVICPALDLGLPLLKPSYIPYASLEAALAILLLFSRMACLKVYLLSKIEQNPLSSLHFFLNTSMKAFFSWKDGRLSKIDSYSICVSLMSKILPDPVSGLLWNAYC